MAVEPDRPAPGSGRRRIDLRWLLPGAPGSGAGTQRRLRSGFAPGEHSVGGRAGDSDPQGASLPAAASGGGEVFVGLVLVATG